MAENEINLFMWGYQLHFRVSIETTAKDLFDRLDRRLSPHVFLLGILIDKREDRHPICLEPEACGFDVDKFSNIKNLATELEKVDEEKNIFYSHPAARQTHEKRISMRAYVNAISRTLQSEDLFGKFERYVSYPTYVEGYLVFIVLELRKDVIERYYSLTKTKMDDRYTIYRSLIDSAVHTFLNASGNALKDPSNFIGAIERPSDELLREAGKQFMYTVSQAGRNVEGLHGFYDACNEIASMKYEGSVCLGNIIVA
jgi:hypothetical protein